MKKCLDWIEKSRPFFGSQKTDEEYESALLMTKCTLETEHDSVSGMSGGKCKKIGLIGKSILREYFHENRTS